MATFRISDAFSQRVFLRNLRRNRAALDEALARTSSGMRVRYPSDDPEAAAEMIRLQEEMQQLAMRQRGISQARPWLQLLEEAATDLGDILTAALQYAVQGSSDTLDDGQYEALAEQVSGLRSQLMSLTQLKISGRYVFSGTMTDTEPFDDEGHYQGNDHEIEIHLDAEDVTINVPGNELFGEMGVGGPMQILADLEEAFHDSDTDRVQALLDELRDAIASNAAMLSRIGNRRKALEDADVRLQDRQLSVQRRVADLGSADMAEAMSDVQKFQTGYQATLAAGSRLFGPTFFDYLG